MQEVNAALSNASTKEMKRLCETSLKEAHWCHLGFEAVVSAVFEDRHIRTERSTDRFWKPVSRIYDSSSVQLCLAALHQRDWLGSL